jgi:ribonuclease Z
MLKLTILGSASATPDKSGRENTYMVLQGDSGKAVLIDCAGGPLIRLSKAGVEFDDLTDVILTHFHPDHTYGFPMLLMGIWLLGRRLPLRVFGLHHCLERVEDQMSFYHWDEWPDFFPTAFHHLPEREDTHVLENEEFRITASPVRHFIPTIGLRIEDKSTGKVLAYSSDTAPCPEVARLAYRADVLIHEAGGDVAGHSNPAQAGAIAAEAEVGRLVLVHYEMPDDDPSTLVDEAATTFDGPIELAEDYTVVEL